MQQLTLNKVGNKCDLNNLREVTTEEGKELARSFGAEFIEASAKTRTNIEQIFITLVRKVREKRGLYNKKSMKDGKKKKLGKSCSIL